MVVVVEVRAAEAGAEDGDLEFGGGGGKEGALFLGWLLDCHVWRWRRGFPVIDVGHTSRKSLGPCKTDARTGRLPSSGSPFFSWDMVVDWCFVTGIARK